MVVMATTYGINSSFGVFFKPIASDLDLSRGVASGTVSIWFLAHNISSFSWGVVADRWNPRWIILMGGLLLAAGLVLLSFVKELWQLYLAYGLIYGMAAGAMSPCMAGMIGRWFAGRSKLGLALAIGFAGTGVGVVAYPPLAQALISATGWRTTFRIFALLSGGLILVTTLFLRPAPARPSAKASPSPQAVPRTSPAKETLSYSAFIAQVLRSPAAWLTFALFGIALLTFFTVIVHLPVHATDVGLSPGTSATVVSVIGIFSLVGKLAGGALGDRFGHHRAYAVSIGLIGLMFFWLLVANSSWMFYLFAVLYGLGYGGWVPQIPSILSRLFGPHRLSILFGMAQLTGGMAGVVGPVLAGALFDATGSYRMVFLLVGTVSLTTMIGAILLGKAGTGARPQPAG